MVVHVVRSLRSRVNCGKKIITEMGGRRVYARAAFIPSKFKTAETRSHDIILTGSHRRTRPDKHW